MPLVEDPTVFLADFGETVTLAGVQVTAIFDAEAVVQGDAALGMVGTQPMLTLPAASCPPNVVGVPAIVRTTSYTVVDARPDGTGWTSLMLERTS